MPANIDLQRLAMYLLSFVVAITFHEFGHAFAADRLGDDTPRRQGRVTLNPIDHLDPIGTIALIILSIYGLGFGWGKPVRFDPSRFRNPSVGDAIVSVTGPLTNLVQAIVVAICIRTNCFQLAADSPYEQLLLIAFSLNVLLFVFNLVPIPPLDGSHILAAILPEGMSQSYIRNMARFGWVLLFAFMFLGLPLIYPTILQIENLLLPTVYLNR